MQDYLHRPLRRIRADLRRDTLAAAGEVGMDRALADLGDPRALADRYADEHGRRGAAAHGSACVRLVGVALAAAAWSRAVIGVRTHATGRALRHRQLGRPAHSS